MDFEWDQNKSQSNKRKHGLDFDQVIRMLLSSTIVAFRTVEIKGEPRQLLLGVLENQIWTVVVTRRGDAVRIISCRRARTSEKRHYEKNI